jgi:signal transduction histidine kinase
MNRRLFLRVAAPALAVGALLFVACLIAIRYIHRLQTNLADILTENVTSLQATADLELAVRQLRFHSLLYQLDPRPERLTKIAADQARFEKALAEARRAAPDADEQELLETIQAAYRAYRAEQERMRAGAGRGSPADAARAVDTQPVQQVVEPCLALHRINQTRMDETAAASQQVSREGYVAMIFLGLAGAVGGLVIGYGISRALRQSIYRLSVRVQDIAQHLDRDVGSVSLVADGDLQTLEDQMRVIVRRVEQAARQLQRQQRELVRAEQLALVGQLAAGVAHEVRNPLTGIKLLVDAALRPKGSHALAGADLQVVRREIGRLEQTVQSFLNFARLPAPEVAPCALGRLVREAWDAVRTRADQQNVALELHAPAEPVIAAADAGQVTTVLVNLFVNALDAMPTGGRIEVAVRPAGDGMVRLSVADTGPGIPSDILGRLFEPFLTTKPHGTGLGLSLSRRILEEHGGRLDGANRPTGGACFTLTLPAPAAETDHAHPNGH